MVDEGIIEPFWDLYKQKTTTTTSQGQDYVCSCRYLEVSVLSDLANLVRSRFDPIKVNIILTLCRNSCHHQNCYRPHSWVSGRCPNILMTIYWEDLQQTSFSQQIFPRLHKAECLHARSWYSRLGQRLRSLPFIETREERKSWWWMEESLSALHVAQAAPSPASGRVLSVSGLDGLGT